MLTPDDRQTVTYRYLGSDDVGWCPMLANKHGAVLVPACLVDPKDRRAKHVIHAGELVDVVAGSPLHDFVRYDGERFVRATRAEIARADGKPVVEAPAPRPEDPGPMWDDMPDGGDEDAIFRHATGQRPTIPDRPPRGNYGYE